MTIAGHILGPSSNHFVGSKLFLVLPAIPKLVELPSEPSKLKSVLDNGRKKLRQLQTLTTKYILQFRIFPKWVFLSRRLMICVPHGVMKSLSASFIIREESTEV